MGQEQNKCGREWIPNKGDDAKVINGRENLEHHPSLLCLPSDAESALLGTTGMREGERGKFSSCWKEGGYKVSQEWERKMEPGRGRWVSGLFGPEMKMTTTKQETTAASAAKRRAAQSSAAMQAPPWHRAHTHTHNTLPAQISYSWMELFPAGPSHIAALTQEQQEGGKFTPTAETAKSRRRGDVAMKRLQRNNCDKGTGGDIAAAAAIENKDPHPDLHPPGSPSSSPSCPPLPLPAMPPSASAVLAAASPATRRSVSMGDFRRVTDALLARSDPPSAAATAPSSKLVTPSSSMEFEAARRRLLEVEERQRVIREMERRLEELREVFVRSEQEVVVHGELVSRISGSVQQGEIYVAENSQRLKKGLRFKKHRPTIVFSSMLGLRTCLPWPVKLK